MVSSKNLKVSTSIVFHSILKPRNIPMPSVIIKIIEMNCAL